MPENGNITQNASNIHYQFRNSDNNQVTYRVVQVGGDENNQQATLSIVTTNGILNHLSQEENNSSSTQQVAIVGNPFNNDSGSEAGTNATSGGNTSGSTEQQMLSGGQFYVMMSPQDMIPAVTTQPNRTMISRPQFPQLKFQRRGDDGSRNTRDDTRRVQHNEVERRRRDKINTWIMKLATMIPDCANDHTKQGQSKGGILAKACDYISDLTNANNQLTESLKDFEQTQINYELCRQQLEEAKQKNDILTQTLKAQGIDVAMVSATSQS